MESTSPGDISRPLSLAERRLKMKTKRWRILFLAVGLAMGLLFMLEAMAQEVPRITKEELKEMLGSPDLVIIDDRTGRDWNASEFKIKGAVREDSAKADEWAGKYPKDKTLVFYCA
jgi:hypothetical protein